MSTVLVQEKKTTATEIAFDRMAQVRADLKAVDPVTDLPALIRVAIEDMNSLDREEYSPCSSCWHGVWVDSCHVCLAGGVLAGTMGIEVGESVKPLFQDRNTEKALMALNCVRVGLYENAYEHLRLGAPNGLDSVQKPREPHFEGWAQAESHVNSLSDIADKLDELEGR